MSKSVPKGIIISHFLFHFLSGAFHISLYKYTLLEMDIMTIRLLKQTIKTKKNNVSIPRLALLLKSIEIGLQVLYDPPLLSPGDPFGFHLGLEGSHEELLTGLDLRHRPECFVQGIRVGLQGLYHL